MSTDFGLTPFASFESEGFERLYNNYIGLRSADLYKTNDPIYGGSGEETLFLQIEIFHDEFSTEMVNEIEVIDDQSCIAWPTEELLMTILYFLRKFFSDLESHEFRKIASEGIWGVPKTIDIVLLTEHPETYEECLGWAARFERDAFLTEVDAITDLDGYFSDAIQYHDSVVEQLVSKYGGEN